MGFPETGSRFCFGTKETEYSFGALPSVAVASPTKLVSWKNWTLAMPTFAPVESVLVVVAVATTFAWPLLGPPPEIVPPSAGLVMATEGREPTMTVVGWGVSVAVVLVVDAITLFLSS
jgi:hypothetical protein